MSATITPAALRSLLGPPPGKEVEVAVLDVRPPAVRIEGHLALSTGVPLHVLEQEVVRLVPRRATPLVLTSDDPQADATAARILDELGYTDVSLLDGGHAGWVAAGERLVTGTNNRSKTLGEWIEHAYGTPTVEPDQLTQWREDGVDVVVLDGRPRGEYLHHHLPGAHDTGGGPEIAYRGLAAITSPETKVVVNCAGRTRSIVGAQSLANTPIANEVYSLRNGTPAWTWAGQPLEQGEGHRLPQPDAVDPALRRWATDTLAAAHTDVVDAAAVVRLLAETERTTLVLDIRHPEEVARGTLPGVRAVQGGQLVQNVDEHLAVRGARVVLVDTSDLVRAAGTVQWLHLLHDGPLHVLVHHDHPDSRLVEALTRVAADTSVRLPDVAEVTGDELAAQLASQEAPQVFDLRGSRSHAAGHLPGSVHARREQLADAVDPRRPVVLLGDTVADADPEGAHDLQAAAAAVRPHFAARDLARDGVEVRVLAGGPETVPVPLTTDDPQRLAPPLDLTGPPAFGPERDAWYRAYFDWEYSLVPDAQDDPDYAFLTRSVRAED